MTPAACADLLKTTFPALFGAGFKPLKLRIQADIQERAPGTFTKQVLSAFLRRYTGSTGYLIALTKAKTRFDLDGNPSAELSEEHRAAAVEELARRRALQQSRREQEDTERRNRAGLLHDFERTTLTVPNFCALKGVEPEALEGLLALARQEAQEPQREAPRGRNDQRRPPGGRDQRRDGGRPAFNKKPGPNAA